MADHDLRGADIASLNPRLVGVHRQGLVDNLAGSFREVRNRCGPKLVVMSAPIGWGKTRIVHEMYERLARDYQSDPPYWPHRIDPDGTANAEPLSRRKRTHPPAFQVPATGTIEYMWWGMLCGQRGDSRRAQVLSDDSTQLFQHSLAIEARSNSRLRTALAAGRLDELSGVYERGSHVLDLLAAFGMAFPPIAWTKVLVDGALASYDAYTRWTRSSSTNKTDSDRRIDPEDSLRNELVDRVADATVNLSIHQIPFVIVLDDAHDADASVLRFIRLTLSEPSARVLVLALTWPDRISEASGEFGKWLNSAEYELHGIVSHVELEPLNTADLVNIVYDAAPETSSETAQLLAERFSPNPFALRQALTFRVVRRNTVDGAIRLDPAQIRSLPSDLLEQYRRKWAELPEAVKDALSVASWQGHRFLPEAAARGAMAIALEESTEAMVAAVDPHAWARVLDSWVQAFVEPDLHLLAEEWWGRCYSTEDSLKVRRAIGAFLAATRDSSSDWSAYSALARQCSLETLLRLDAEGTLLLNDDRPDVALELAASFAEDLRYRDALRVLEGEASRANDDGAVRFRVLRSIAQMRGLLGEIDFALAAIDSALGAAESVSVVEHREAELERISYVADLGRYDEASALIGEFTPESLSEAALVRYSILVGRVLAECGDFEGALAETELTVSDAARIWGRSAPETVEVINTRAWFLSRIGAAESALAAAEDAYNRVAEVLPDKHPVVLEALNNLARFSFRVGDISTAVELGSNVAELRSQVFGATHHKALTSRDNLGAYFLADGRAEEAMELFESVLDGWAQSPLGVDHPKALSPRRNLALALARCGQFEAALARITEVVEVSASLLGEDHPNTARALMTGADIALGGGSEVRYREFRSRALAATQDLPEDHPERRAALELPPP